MNKKRWVWLVLAVLAVVGYFKLFYKTVSTHAVVKSADCIVALDVKRITNTIIWNWITTPSQWKKISFSSGSTSSVSWKDMVTLPDYILAFHAQQQPLKIWYVLLQVKDEKDFARGLSAYQFQKQGNNMYFSKEAGIGFYKDGSSLLATNASIDDSTYLLHTAAELFNSKSFITQQTLDKITAAKSHCAVFIGANTFLQDDAVIAGNFNKNSIEINGDLHPRQQYHFTENNFSYHSASLCTLNFTQPSAAVSQLFSAAEKDNISRLLGFDVDATFLQNNKYYQLDIAAIQPRVDSAITYAYDNDFNKVEKVELNTVQEPAFHFTATGDSAEKVLRYLKQADKIETTDAGLLFKPMPFVKSYFTVKNNQEFNIISSNYQSSPTDQNDKAVLLLHILFSKIPADLLHYLPGGVMNSISNIESMQLKVSTPANGLLKFSCNVYKKKNDWPIIK